MNYDDAAKLVSKAMFPEDIFPDRWTMGEEYKRLATLLHPDKNPDWRKDHATKIFASLSEWYSKAQEKVANRTFGIKILCTLKSKKGTYALEKKLHTGDISDLYGTLFYDDDADDNLVKLVRTPKNNDLLANEATVLRYLREESRVKELEVMRHIPILVDSFEIQNSAYRRRANVFRRPQGFHPLVMIRKSFPNGIQARSMAWMFNRALGALTACHQAGYVHGAMVPEHVLVNTGLHGGMLWDWCYAVKRGERIKAICPTWKEFYPAEILNKAPVDFSTDLYMLAASMWYVLGGTFHTRTIPDTVPAPIVGLLRYCLLAQSRRPSDVFAFYDEFNEVLEKLYGPPKFIKLELPKEITT